MHYPSETHYPNLQLLCAAYLFPGFAAFYPTAGAALEKYCSSGPSSETAGCLAEVDSLLDQLEAGQLSEARIESVLDDLFCSYYPPGENLSYEEWLRHMSARLRKLYGRPPREKHTSRASYAQHQSEEKSGGKTGSVAAALLLLVSGIGYLYHVDDRNSEPLSGASSTQATRPQVSSQTSSEAAVTPAPGTMPANTAQTASETPTADDTADASVSSPVVEAIPAEPLISRETEARESYDQALKLDAAGLVADTLRMLDHAVSLDGDFADARAARGILLGHLKRCQDALEDFNKAIELNPAIARWYLNRGNCLWNLDKTESAIRDYDAALSLDRSLAEAFAKRGMAYGHINQFSKSESDLREALRLGQGDAHSFYYLGIALYSQRRFVEAIRELSRAIELKPDFVAAYQYRGRAKELLGKPIDALVDIRAAQSLAQRK